MTRTALLILLGGITLGGASPPAFAQAPPPAQLPRHDFTGLAAWQNVNKANLSDGDYRNDWYNRGAYGGGVFGWYWTDHHKTELEIGASNRVRFWTYSTYRAEGLIGSAGAEYRFSTRRVAVAQQYQFFRNAWFHPHVAAGADLNWETTSGRVDPVIAYGPQPGGARPIRPAEIVGPETRLRVRPFAEVGFKSYVTPRAFFRTDLRMLARRGVDEVQVRFGMGVDF
ncbi:MAG: hypothetical protein ABJC89_15170 [Acidobacteriota bacterium]